MNICEELKTLPGFLYQIGTNYYFLGKWICKPCTDQEATDTHMMYEVCFSANESANAQIYFQKLRAYSDFALDVPFNPAQIAKDTTELVASLSDFQAKALERQIEQVRTFL